MGKRLGTSVRTLLRPSAALALVVVLALVGTAVAAKMITGKQIKNNSITGKDIKNGSLSAKDFNGSVQGAQGPAGPQGAQGPQGPQGPTGLANLEQVKTNSSFPANTTGAAVTAVCPTGKVAISGGYTIQDLTPPFPQILSDSNNASAGVVVDRWTVTASNTDGAPVNVTVVANCATVNGGFTGS